MDLSKSVTQRQSEIHSKGFNMGSTLNYSLSNERLDYSKIKIGVKTLSDAVMNLGEIPKIGPYRISKSTVLKALAEKDLNTLRMISDYF